MRFQCTPEALSDIEDALVWSAASFGRAAARRYQKLIHTALREITANPALQGSRVVDDLNPIIMLYHLRHARKRAAVEGLIVKRPRHFLAYRVIDAGVVEILRLLHDSMDIDQQLEDWRDMD